MSYKDVIRILEKLHLKNGLRRIVDALHFHVNNELPDIFIFSTPRSGSTLLMDIIAVNPKIKGISEPLHKIGKKDVLPSYIENTRWRYIEFTAEERKQIIKYFNYLIKERMSTYPFTFEQHHWFTDRCVIKCLRALGQEGWFINHFNMQALYLIRHPIPASLSRLRNGWGVSRSKKSFKEFYSSDYYQENILNDQIKSLIENKIESGSMLDLQVIKWCLENVRTLKNLGQLDGLTFLTYEELTIQSEKVINFLADHLNLPKRDKMIELVNTPSHSSSYSQEQTMEAIKGKKKQYLIEKWKKQVNADEIKSVSEILDIFEIDVYESGSILPNQNYAKFL